jgi:hypothetical protein
LIPFISSVENGFYPNLTNCRNILHSEFLASFSCAK